MKCPHCGQEAGKLNAAGEPMIRTSGFVLKADGAVMLCPHCKKDIPAGGDLTKALVLFLKADVAGYTRKDGVVVRPHHDKRPVARATEKGADGWEIYRRGRDGSVEHRLLVSDGGAPRYRGSGKRYAYVFEHADGEVYGQSEHGYTRRYDNVDAAKAAVAPAKK